MKSRFRRLLSRVLREECMPTVYPVPGGFRWTCRHGGARRRQKYGRVFTRRADAIYASRQHWLRMAKGQEEWVADYQEVRQ